MDEETFNKCTDDLVILIESFKKIIENPNDDLQEELKTLKSAAQGIYTKVNKI